MTSLWRSPDDAAPIGALPLHTKTSAMKVVDDRGTLVYGEEVPIRVGHAWRFIEDRTGHRFGWWRFEAKVDARSPSVRRGDELVIANHPYGSGWIHSVTLKPGSKKGSEGRTDFSTRIFESEGHVYKAVETLPHDYWEKGNYYTGGISEPSLPLCAMEMLRNEQRRGVLVFGICRNFTICERNLLASEHVKRLLGMTENGSIAFWSPRARFGTPPKLLDEVKAEGFELMLLAVRQALAGPHKDAERWLGRPVSEKVDQIYRGHLNRRNRRLAKENSNFTEYREDTWYERVDDDCEPDEMSF